MRLQLGKHRDRLVDRLLGIELRKTTTGLQRGILDILDRQTKIDGDLSYVKSRLGAQLEYMRIQLDDIQELRTRLEALRETRAYADAFSESEPLVSVRIGSYQKTDELIDVAIASVLQQSYERFEVVVVNDGPNEKTRAAIEKLGDPRIRFAATPQRGSYPEDPRSRWMVAGVPNGNEAARLSQGTWLAPLDDDDEFTPDHLEKLVSLAVSDRVELAYGALVQRNLINNEEVLIWSDPPAISNFSFQGSIYLRSLHSLFQYNSSSWVIDEPADWNLIRRMKAAGVTHSAMSDVVGLMRHIPYTHKVIS